MFQSRDEVRQVYLTVWRKLQQNQLLEPMEALIAAVIEIHPEYHSLLEDGDAATQTDFTPEQGQTNPFLQGLDLGNRVRTFHHHTILFL